jgi:hypothetical protein
MDRKELIARLVERKLANKGQAKVFCVCIGGMPQGAASRRAEKK